MPTLNSGSCSLIKIITILVSRKKNSLIFTCAIISN